MCVCVCVCVRVGGGGGYSMGGMELRVGSNMILFLYILLFSRMAHVPCWCVYIIHC